MDDSDTTEGYATLGSEHEAGYTFSNLPIIGYSQAEFILDFIKDIPGIPKADVKS